MRCSRIAGSNFHPSLPSGSVCVWPVNLRRITGSEANLFPVWTWANAASKVSNCGGKPLSSSVIRLPPAGSIFGPMSTIQSASKRSGYFPAKAMLLRPPIE